MRDQLKSHITAALEGIRHLSVDDAADLIAEVADDLAGDRTEDMFNGAILDGIRWGYAAAHLPDDNIAAEVRASIVAGMKRLSDGAIGVPK